MNAAEHIVQSFFWQALSDKKPRGRRYLTISNVIGGNNREIDILAVSGDGLDRLRVECEIAVNWFLSPEYIEGRIRYKLLDDPHSCRLIKEEVFGDQDYRKVFVVWSSPYTVEDPLPGELVQQGVEVWSMTDLLQDLLHSVGCSNFQDDILRVISMLSAMLSMDGALRRCECKPVSPTVNSVPAIECVDAVAALARKHALLTGRKTVKDVHVLSAIGEILRIADGADSDQ